MPFFSRPKPAALSAEERRKRNFSALTPSGMSSQLLSQSEQDIVAFSRHIHAAYTRKNVQGNVPYGADGHDAWKKGICFGLSMLFLSAVRAGDEKEFVARVAAEFKAFAARNVQPGQPLGSGFLEMLAGLHVMQEGNVSMLVQKGQTVRPKVARMLGRGSVGHTQHPVDVHMAENGFTPHRQTGGDHTAAFCFELKNHPSGGYASTADGTQIRQLVQYLSQPNSYSYLSFRIPEGGHAMAASAVGGHITFYDPNFGVFSTRSVQGMTRFLSRAIPFIYQWKPASAATKDARRIPSVIPSSEIRTAALTFQVRRYTAR